MRDIALALADHALLAGHLALIAFNCLGWAWQRTRRANLVVLCLTGFSWGVLGLRHGLGYCPLTDWHWAVKRARGEGDLPMSFLKHVFDRATGLDASPFWTDVVAAVVFFGAVALSITLNARDFRRA